MENDELRIDDDLFLVQRLLRTSEIGVVIKEPVSIEEWQDFIEGSFAGRVGQYRQEA